MFRTAFLAAVVLAAVAAADDRPSDAAIREAITLLEAKKAQADKKEDQDRLGAAIADLEKHLPKDKAAAGPDHSRKLTPALLAKKFVGKAAYSPKTGELSVVYDFKSKDQLKDFALKDAKPVVRPGALYVVAGDSIEHAARFESVTVSGTLAIESPNRETMVVSVSGAASLRYWEFNGLHFGVWSKGEQVAEKSYGRPPLTNIPFKFTVTPKKVLAKVLGAAEVGGNINIPAAGAVTLHGGTGGATYTNVVISGVPDKDWVEGLN